ncbi:hypothetical protein F4810DRAFT_719950 [Camillea tinctor]|nr:hypothetical protein F4810DRAFT_719950 [Camillea tinctor]
MSQPLRQLLPNPSTPNDSSSNPQRSKRTSAIAACEACRRRKTKAGLEAHGRPRCATCIERKTQCDYTTRPTETHLKAQRRKLSDLELRSQENEAYRDFIDIIQSRSEPESIQMVQRLRTGTDIQEVLKLVHTGTLLLELLQNPEYRLRYEFPYVRGMPLSITRWQNPYLASLLFETVSSLPAQQTESPPQIWRDITDETQKMYLIPYHAVELIDSRIAEANVSTWTKVPAGNSTLRALLEIYFVSLFPFYPQFDKGAFLDDLLAGTQRFCSPFLVNAVLAVAWHGYSPVNRRAEHWVPGNLGYRFLAEALRLYDLERSNPTITTVQATALIHLEYFINGVDELGRPYLKDSIEMACRLGIFNPNIYRDQEWQSVVEVTAWGLFNWQAQVAFHTFQPPLLPDPPQYPLLEQATENLELHVKYPLGEEPIHTSNNLLFKALCSFRVMINNVAKETCKSPRNSFEISYNEALFFRVSLTTWYENLPDPLKPHNIALPSHLNLHMHYHNLLIYLFEPFENMVPIDGADSPGDIVTQSKACFETLLRLYYLRHGFESYDVALLQFLPLLAFSALRDLPAAFTSNNGPRLEELRSTIMLCAKGLWDQGRNSFASQALFWLYLESLDPGEVQLVRDTIEPEMPDDTMDVIAREVRSSWPVGLFGSTKTNRFRTLNDFTSWWKRQNGMYSIAMNVIASGKTSNVPSSSMSGGAS